MSACQNFSWIHYTIFLFLIQIKPVGVNQNNKIKEIKRSAFGLRASTSLCSVSLLWIFCYFYQGHRQDFYFSSR